MPQKKRVVRCELDEHFIGVLARAKKHGYPKYAEAVRAGLRLLDEEMSRNPEATLSPRARGTSLKDQLEDHDSLRGVSCIEEA